MTVTTVCICIAAALSAVAASGEAASAADARRAVTIVHTNDLHAAFKPDRDNLGGAACLAGCLRTQREKYGELLLVDAGDRVQKGDLFDHNSKGLAAYELLNLLEFDAFALGNTDFAYGLEALEAAKNLSVTPILCMNAAYSDGRLVADAPSLIKQVSGVKVAMLGVFYDPHGEDPVAKNYGGQLVFQDPQQGVRQWLTEHRQDADLFLILSHLGWHQDVGLADALSGPVVIVGGHSHTVPEAPYRAAGGALVVQAGSYLRYAGRLQVELEPDADGIAGFEWELLKLDPAVFPPEQRIAEAVASLEARFAPGMSEVIGAAEADFEEWFELSNLGGEALRHASGADVALTDRGFVRDNLLKGRLTKEDIHRKSPYDNKVVVFEATGGQLLNALRHNLAAPVKARLDLNGASAHFRVAPEAQTGTAVVLVRSDLDEAKTYRVACTDYIMKSSEFFFGCEFGHQALELSSTEAQIRYIQARGSIAPDPHRGLTCDGCEEPNRTVKY